MAYKEINIFSTSFLDLLSGALAAVIILFIIVPKVSQTQQDALEQLEQLNLQVDDLNQLVERARSSIPVDVYEEILSQIEEMQNTIAELNNQISGLQQQVSNLQNRISEIEAQNQNLRQQLVEQENLAEENRRLRQQITELERTIDRQSDRDNISDGKVFGMNAQLGIVCMWPEDVDVDLHVINLSSGEDCYYNNKRTRFGNLMEDITSRTAPDDDRYELFYQSRIITGKYRINTIIYSNTWKGIPAVVEGYIVMFPGKPNQKKIPYGPITISSPQDDGFIGDLVVTETNITLNR